jgi:hypothetical protein
LERLADQFCDSTATVRYSNWDKMHDIPTINGRAGHSATSSGNLLFALLPAGRKFCKITQIRPKKENEWPGKLAAVRPPILDKSGRKPAEKTCFSA